ncbi:hypothetical protein QWZ13_04660 [Reinekea marina]|uniref:hypothetical protein n=1 Tax=Reinekea marina TaxID=1310421 RepID=UPI0025B35D4E|nr:hypothetical protein [Reinekea marina]MDN3648197.1 hypothetical protein [Reinekea marina]
MSPPQKRAHLQTKKVGAFEAKRRRECFKVLPAAQNTQPAFNYRFRNDSSLSGRCSCIHAPLNFAFLAQIPTQ